MRWTPVRRFALGGAVCAALLAPSAQAAVGAVQPAPCAGVPFVSIRCQVVSVPLNRSGAVPGTIGLRVTTWGGAGHGTLLVLPDADESATDVLVDANLTPMLRQAAGQRRLAALDRRGTGDSGPLTCRALARGRGPVRAAADCAAELGPARASYTTAESVADVEAVRAALGEQRLTIVGIGEGGRLALAYAGAHPDRVERLVLDSPVPPAGADPLRRSSFAAVGAFERQLCLRACPYARDPVGELARLARRVARAPLVGSLFDGRGRRRHVAVSAADLGGVLLDHDLDSLSVIELPAVVQAALRGDRAPLARLVDAARSDVSTSSAAALVATCEDGPLPWAAGAAPAARRAALATAEAAIPAATLAPLGAAALAGLQRAASCLDWPASASAPPLPSAMPHGVPTLVLAGELDLSTPLADSAALARRIPGAELLRVPMTGHGVLASSDPFDSRDPLDSCVPAALRAFSRGDPVRPCPRRSTEYDGIHPLPLRGWAWGFPVPPASLAAVRPSPHLPPRAGRTLNAVRQTMYDGIQQALMRGFGAPSRGRALRFGGLRGGFAVYALGSWVMHRYAFVPGVAVSMRYGHGRPWLQIGGAAAVHAELRLGEGCGDSACFVGRLAGRVVHVTVPGTA